MSNPKLEGLIDAIEGESKIPSPSHSNLARLIVMFFRELISDQPETARVKTSEPDLSVPVSVTTSDATGIVADVKPEPESEPMPEPKHTKEKAKHSEKLVHRPRKK